VSCVQPRHLAPPFPPSLPPPTPPPYPINPWNNGAGSTAANRWLWVDLPLPYSGRCPLSCWYVIGCLRFCLGSIQAGTAVANQTAGFWGWAINLHFLAKANIVRGGTRNTSTQLETSNTSLTSTFLLLGCPCTYPIPILRSTATPCLRLPTSHHLHHPAHPLVGCLLDRHTLPV
jgi:hypothetical protein